LKRPQTAKAFRQELDACYEEALAEEGQAKAKL
jgi:long-chain acyl-CoA synthetase